MKKLISIIAIIALLSSTFLLSGCKDEEITLSEKIETKITAYKTDLEDSADTLDTPEKVVKYLSNWASSKGITYINDGHANLIMEIETSEAYVSAPPTVVFCPYDALQIQNSIAPLSIGMYLAKNNENTGRLKVIFYNNTGNNFDGLRALSKEYITDNSNVFCLSSNSKNIWSMNTGASSSYEFKGKLEYTAPTKNKAYKVTIAGLPGGVPDEKVGSYPNPIKRLGNLLAQFKTNALIYELSDFSGGSAGGLYPESATMTVLIEADDFDKFQKRIDKDIEKFNDKILEDYPDATYTYEEVSIPEQVMTADSMNAFVSLNYALLNGSYYRDEVEEKLISFTNIGSILLDSNSYTICAIANSRTKESLAEIDNNYQLICGLSDVAYKKTGSSELWSENTETQFAEQICEAYHAYSDKNMEFKDFVPVSSAPYARALNAKCNIVNLSVNEEKLEKYTGTLLTFMLQQPHEEQQMTFN